MYGKKILNKNIKLYYADAENASTPQYRSNVKIIPLIEYPTITAGTPETRSGVFCRSRDWVFDGIDYFYNDINYRHESPEFFAVHHVHNSKKRIIKDLTIEYRDYLNKNKERRFADYNLFRINRDKFQKSNLDRSTWGLSDVENITHGVFTRFSQRKITFTDLNFKLCANEDIIILPNYNVHVDVPTDGYYKSSRSSLVVHTDKPHMMFTITLTYTLSFLMFVGMYIIREVV